MPPAKRSSRTSYGRPKGEAELLELARVLSVSFGFEAEGARRWFDKAGLDNVRVLRAGGQLKGGLLQLPMGQHFGGRRIDMVGYAGVGVAPEARARGVATDLMRRAMRELSKREVPISTLYPASLPLYRRAGYGVAGGWYRLRAAAADFPRCERPLTARAFESSDERQVRALYTRRARERNGWLDRSEYIWERTRRIHEGNHTTGHVLEKRGRIVAYVFYRQKRNWHGFDLEISDMAADTPDAARSLMRFISDHRSMAGEVCWHGSVDDPLLSLMPEHRYQIDLRHHWMLRIVDVKRALEARGYPLGLEATLGLDVRDDVLATNRGRFRLDISGGRGEVKRGGRGELRLDVRALATLFSGHHDGRALALVSGAEGSDKVLQRASAIFAGDAPSLPDMF
jgi:predicted acetyltransferase